MLQCPPMLAEALRRERRTKGLSVGRLSKRSGVPEWVNHNIEGIVMPHKDALR